MSGFAGLNLRLAWLAALLGCLLGSFVWALVACGWFASDAESWVKI